MPREIILAHHLVISGYGFWIPNDPRGSGSSEIREKKFEEVGSIPHGRKKQQPTRQELRAFYEEVNPLLEHNQLWFDAKARVSIAGAFAEVTKRRGYTVWACFVGSNHAHLCIRYHRDAYERMHEQLTAQSRAALVSLRIAEPAHPVWAERPYSIFLRTPDDIRRIICYIEENAAKEGLPKQVWTFVKAYDGWGTPKGGARDPASR